MGRLLLPLLPLYSFMHRSILLSSFHSCLYDCSPVPTIICGCLPCRSVDSRHFHVAFACISVAEIRTAYCTRSSDELTIQHVFWDAPELTLAQIWESYQTAGLIGTKFADSSGNGYMPNKLPLRHNGGFKGVTNSKVWGSCQTAGPIGTNFGSRRQIHLGMDIG